MTAASQTWTEEFVEVAGGRVFLRRAGTGAPLLVLHHDFGDEGEMPFFDRLAERHSVFIPTHPGFGRSDRPDWMRSVRDIAAIYQWLLAELRVERAGLVGLGFGGWIAAEMATLAPRDFGGLVLVDAMGVKPPAGEILDQALLNHVAYIRAGLHNQATFEAVFGAEPPTEQLESWEINRETIFRVAWKPYMFNPALPHLLGGVRAPALVVWGRDDRVVPLSAGEAYTAALPNARLEVIEDCGHLVDLEQPDKLAELVSRFVGTV
jgi:pimeloyl-ACP methyl ester carboxylesterase